jgi:acetoacetyl-CoA synthetase
MPLFIVLNNDSKLSESLEEKINNTLRKKCSPRHVPDLIKPVPDIPYTLSGKKMEVPVKRLFLKNQTQKKPDLGTIRNPEAMKYFIKLAKEM